LTVSILELKSRLRCEPETGCIFWIKGNRTGEQAFTYLGKRGYHVSTFRHEGGCTTLAAHRVAWALYHGEWPSGQIDHINGNRTDNRLSNLRDVVNAENAKNMAMKRNNTSGVNGVYLHRQTGKWCAQINAFGKAVGLGLFTEKRDAVIARKAAERVLGYAPGHGRRTQDMIEAREANTI